MKKEYTPEDVFNEIDNENELNKEASLLSEQLAELKKENANARAFITELSHLIKLLGFILAKVKDMLEKMDRATDRASHITVDAKLVPEDAARLREATRQAVEQSNQTMKAMLTEHEQTVRKEMSRQLGLPHFPNWPDRIVSWYTLFWPVLLLVYWLRCATRSLWITRLSLAILACVTIYLACTNIRLNKETSELGRYNSELCLYKEKYNLLSDLIYLRHDTLSHRQLYTVETLYADPIANREQINTMTRLIIELKLKGK